MLITEIYGPESELIHMFESCEVKVDFDVYSNSIFYMKDGILFFELKKKHKQLFYSKEDVFMFFAINFSSDLNSLLVMENIRSYTIDYLNLSNDYEIFIIMPGWKNKVENHFFWKKN